MVAVKTKTKKKGWSKAKLIRLLKKYYYGRAAVDRIRIDLQKGEVDLNEALRKAANTILRIKTVLPLKKQSRPRAARVYEAGSWRVGVEVVDNVDVHPWVEDFVPRILGVNYKNKTVFMRVQAGSYVSCNHRHILRSYVHLNQPKDDMLAILVRYELSRNSYIRDMYSFRKFAHLFLLSSSERHWVRFRIPHPDSIEEALEKMKPAEVVKAEKEGRQVILLACGFLVEMKGGVKITARYSPGDTKYSFVVEEDGRVKVFRRNELITVLPHPRFKLVGFKTSEGIWEPFWR